MEPYITSLALYDSKAGRKLTENFYFDINTEQIREKFPLNCPSKPVPLTNGSSYLNDDVNELLNLPKDWLTFPKQAILSITAPHPDIFLVVKIDKILQGGINNTTEPYLKSNKDPKLALKLHKNVKAFHQKIGHFRMPFAWAAKPLFRLYSSELDTAIEFPAIYRQENNKLKDEELLKLLAEYRKPDKFSKLTVIPGSLKVTVEPLTELPNSKPSSIQFQFGSQNDLNPTRSIVSDSLTTTLSQLKPFPNPPTSDPSFELTEFVGTTERDVHPFTTFINHLFVYPLALNFDSQKLFSRARNIAVIVELRDSDAEGAKPLTVSKVADVLTLLLKEMFSSLSVSTAVPVVQLLCQRFLAPSFITIQIQHFTKKSSSDFRLTSPRNTTFCSHLFTSHVICQRNVMLALDSKIPSVTVGCHCW